MAEMRTTTPGTAQAVSDPSRRKLMAGAVVVAFGGAGCRGSGIVQAGSTTVLPAEEPDAELIGLCARCDVLQDEVDALHVRPSDDMTIDQEIAWEQARDILVGPINDRQEVLLERICELQAATPQGQAAWARTLIGWDKEVCRPGNHHCWSEELVSALVRDLVASA